MSVKYALRQLVRLEKTQLARTSFKVSSTTICNRSLNTINNRHNNSNNNNNNNNNIIHNHRNLDFRERLVRIHNRVGFVRSFTSESGDEEVDCGTLQGLLDYNDDKPYLIDVRTTREIEDTGKIANDAVHIPVDDIEYALQLSDDVFEKLFGAEKPDDEGQGLIFYCRSGIRSYTALNTAHSYGYHRSKHLRGGIMAWLDHKNSR